MNSMNKLFKLLFMASLLAAIGCQGMAVGSLPSFAGPWVVDMAASEKINPDLVNNEYMRETVSPLMLAVDMEQHELIIQHRQDKDKIKRLPFTVVEQTPNLMLIEIDESYAINSFKLELKDGTLVFVSTGSDVGRDSFVFVPAGE